MAQVPNLDPTLSSVNPSDASAAKYLAMDQTESVVFVNLHEYHERAQYPADYDGSGGPADVSGMEAYHRYLDPLGEVHHKTIGGRMVIVAPIDVMMVGSGPWHEMVITYYPTRASAMDMAASPGYAATVVHRLAGLKSVTAFTLNKQALDFLPNFL